MSKLLIKNCTKASFFNDAYDAIKVLQNVDILIEENIITKIDRNIAENCKTINGTGKLVFPGLCNGFCNCLASKITRTISEDQNYERFDDTPIYVLNNPLENTAIEQLDEEQLSSILELAIYESVSCGTTTLVGQCSVWELPIILRLCEKYGVRAMFSPRLMSRKTLPTVDARGQYDDISADIDEDAMIAWNKEMVKKTAGKMQRVAMGIGSVETTSPSLMEKAARAAAQQDCFLMATLNETRREREICEARYGLSPTQLLHDNGVLLRSKSILGGNTFSDQRDWTIIKDHEAIAAIYPLQCLHNGSTPPFIDFLNEEIPTIFGSGSHSLDMFRQMNAIALSGKIESGKRRKMNAFKAFYPPTAGSGEMLGFNNGQVEVGFVADLLIVDINKPKYMPFTMPIAEIVYAVNPADISHVIIDGVIQKEWDNNMLTAKANKAFEVLWQHARRQGEI